MKKHHLKFKLTLEPGREVYIRASRMVVEPSGALSFYQGRALVYSVTARQWIKAHTVPEGGETR